MNIIGGYTLDLYCLNSNAEHHKGGYYNFNEQGSPKFPIIFFNESPRCYYITRQMAKNKGWILKKNGVAICPLCNEMTEILTKME